LQDAKWRSKALRAYQRRTLVADALIAGTYLAGTDTRRVRRALGKDTVSRVWRKVKSDWDAWNARSLAEEPIVRLILDGKVVRVRLDRKATSISLLVPGATGFETPTCRRGHPTQPAVPPCHPLPPHCSGVVPSATLPDAAKHHATWCNHGLPW
jgi:hypothetical protein